MKRLSVVVTLSHKIQQQVGPTSAYPIAAVTWPQPHKKDGLLWLPVSCLLLPSSSVLRLVLSEWLNGPCLLAGSLQAGQNSSQKDDGL